ncbi:MAG: hypothetical protein ABEJ65_09575, partial [bacterium]
MEVSQFTDDLLEHCARRGFDLKRTMDYALDRLQDRLSFHTIFLRTEVPEQHSFFSSDQYSDPPQKVVNTLRRETGRRSTTEADTLWIIRPLTLDEKYV